VISFILASSASAITVKSTTGLATVAGVWVTALIATITAGIYIAPKWREIGVKKDEGEIDRLRKDVASFRMDLEACEKRHETLETRLRAIEFENSIYLARWKKDSAKRITWISDKAFLMIFAPLGFKTRDEVDGKTFAELLVDPVAVREIDLLDRAALSAPGSVASCLIQFNATLPFMMVLKVATMNSDGLMYEGYAYQDMSPEILAANGAGRQIRQIAISTESLLEGKT
jgi:hypothetical protein